MKKNPYKTTEPLPPVPCPTCGLQIHHNMTHKCAGVGRKLEKQPLERVPASALNWIDWRTPERARDAFTPDANGFTTDGFYIGANRVTDIFKHPAPLPVPEIKAFIMTQPTGAHWMPDSRVGNQTSNPRSRFVVSRSYASIGNAEEMRNYYGKPTIKVTHAKVDDPNINTNAPDENTEEVYTEHDGARITHTSKTSESFGEPVCPVVLTVEDIAEMHGQETLRRIRGEQCAK